MPDGLLAKDEMKQHASGFAATAAVSPSTLLGIVRAERLEASPDASVGSTRIGPTTTPDDQRETRATCNVDHAVNRAVEFLPIPACRSSNLTVPRPGNLTEHAQESKAAEYATHASQTGSQLCGAATGERTEDVIPASPDRLAREGLAGADRYPVGPSQGAARPAQCVARAD